jgi:hypothetical protein
MKKFIKIDHELNFSSICFSEQEVIEGCGYDADEITFEELLKEIEGVYEIIEIEGEVRWLTGDDEDEDDDN